MNLQYIEQSVYTFPVKHVTTMQMVPKKICFNEERCGKCQVVDAVWSQKLVRWHQQVDSQVDDKGPVHHSVLEIGRPSSKPSVPHFKGHSDQGKNYQQSLDDLAPS